MTATRRLAAILAADVAGYSRLIGSDEEGTLNRLRSIRAEVIDPKISEHRGRIVKTTGDGFLVEFTSVVDALRCATEWQHGMGERNAAVPGDNRIEFRIGVHQGDIVVEDGDIFGDGVNVAARLEGLAEPGGICISARVQEDVAGRLELTFEDLGEQMLKNIARPVRVYRVRLATTENEPKALPTGSGPALTLPEKPSIAVLPFQNMSGDPEQEYFADGIAEDIITLLSKSRFLFVIARNSTFTYKGKAVDTRVVARELGVRYVLEGSVRRAGDRVRVTAQLIDAGTGAHLWAERYDRQILDIFSVQDEITAAVSAAILPTMERTERERAARKPPDSLDAWECYHRGQWHFGKLEPAHNEFARNFFRRAIELDPGFAAAYAGIAVTYLIEVTVFVSPALRSEFLPRATEHARRSIEVDPTNAIGHCALSYVLMLAGRHEEAMAEADIAVGVDPNHAWGYASQGSARTFGGWPREAIEPLNTAIQLSPFDPQMARWLHHLARAYYFLCDYRAAVAIARQACHSFPNYRPTYRALIASLGQLGQIAEAQSVMSDAVARHGDAIRFAMLNRMPELREADHAHMIEGYRKTGVIT